MDYGLPARSYHGWDWGERDMGICISALFALFVLDSEGVVVGDEEERTKTVLIRIGEK